METSTGRAMPRDCRAACISLSLGVLMVLVWAFLAANASAAGMTNGAWTWENPLPSGNGLQGACFTSDAHGYAVGINGTVISTSDGGATWTPLASGTTAQLNDVTFLDASTGIVVGANGTILKTTDAGATWAAMLSGTTQSLYSVAFTGAGAGYAVGTLGTILTTTDSGATWSVVDAGTTQNLYGVAFPAADTGFAVGYAGTILQSTDAGATWQAQTSGITTQLNDLSFVDTLHGWAVGSSGAIRTTADGGATWTGQSSGTTQQLNDVVFADASTGWASGSSGTIRRTVDGGMTWSAQTSGTTLAQNALAVRSTDLAYVVGGSGGVRKTTNAGATWTLQTPGVTAQLNDVSFLDIATGCAAGTTGTIVTTSDGGATWTQRTSGVTSTLNCAKVVDASTMLAAGSSGAIRRSTNGGATWAAVTSGTTRALFGFAFTSASTGYVAGSSGTIRRTTDGGATWSGLTSGTTIKLLDVAFPSTSIGYVVGASGTIRKTSDGGTSWSAQTSGVTAQLNDVSFATDDTGYAVGNTGTVLKTTNGGATWTVLTSGVTVTLNTVSAVSADVAYIAGASGTVRKTVNGGATWNVLTPGATQTLVSLWFPSATTGHVVGAGGVILGTTVGGVHPPSGTDDAPTGWRNSAVTVTITPQAGSLPIASTHWRIDGQGWNEGTSVPVAAPVDHSNDGAHAIDYYSTDTEGHDQATKHCTVRIDTQAPSTFGLGLAADDQSGWQAGTGSYGFAPSDALSGVAETDYTVEGGDPVADDGSTHTLEGEGSHAVTYWSTDQAGNQEAVQTGYVNIDLSAPTVGDDAPVGWSNTRVTVSLNAHDSVSGVSKTQYRAAGATDWIDASGDQFAVEAPVDHLNDGAHTYEYRALDKAGNPSALRNCTVKIDTLAPAVTDVVPVDGAGYVFASGVSADWTAADGGSGVVSQVATLDGTPIAKGDRVDMVALGPHSFALVATDAAGNGSEVRTNYDVITAEFAAAPTVGGGATSFTIGTTQTIAWTMTLPVGVGDGHFDVVANDATHHTSYLIESLPADGSAEYSWDWNIALPAGSGWHITVEYDRAGGGTLTSPDSTTFTLQTPAIAVTAPLAGATWESGSTQSITWSLNTPVSNGEFRVCLVAPSGKFYVNRQVLPEAGRLDYSSVLTVSVPAGAGYRANLKWRPTVGSGTWQAVTNGGAFDVSPKPAITITAPSADASWQIGSTQTISWSLNTPVSNGEFRVCLLAQSGQFYFNEQVLPEAGRLDYSSVLTVSVPAGAGYRANLKWRPTVGSGAWQAVTNGGAFAVTPKPAITITAPLVDASWRIGSTQTISWSLNTPVSNGEFRVCLLAQSGQFYFNEQVLPEAGRLDYSSVLTVSVPAGAGYRANLKWRPTVGSGAWQAVTNGGAFEVTPR